MNFNNIPHIEQLDGSYGKALYGLNSEFDDFSNVKKPKATKSQKQRVEALHEKLMARYRNWSEARNGGKFSQTRLCVLPNTVLTVEDKLFSVLQIEFSANDNEFTGGVQEHEGYDDATLQRRLSEFLIEPPTNVKLGRDTEHKSYHFLFVIAEEGHEQELFDYIDKLDALFTGEYQDLQKSHEWIG